MTDSAAYKRLCNKLGYQFTDTANLQLALTHRSAAKAHNERLEFLGDAVLGVVIAERLYQQFPKQTEGTLTRLRASLVKGDTLAELGREFALGEVLKLGSGELKSGGKRRSSILADAVEAIIGAIYLEAGFEQARERVLAWFDSRLTQLNPAAESKDNKTQLQEYLQGRGLPLPDYEVINITGKDHAQTFEVSCTVANLSPLNASGSSRKIAEQNAAKLALAELQK